VFREDCEIHPFGQQKKRRDCERTAIYTNNRIHRTIERNVGFEDLTAVTIKNTE
jgi:hypothetical protein